MPNLFGFYVLKLRTNLALEKKAGFERIQTANAIAPDHLSPGVPWGPSAMAAPQRAFRWFLRVTQQ